MLSLNVRLYTHCMSLTLIGLVPTYLCIFLQRTVSCSALRRNDILDFSAPCSRTETGKEAFHFLAFSAWNIFQSELKPDLFNCKPSTVSQYTDDRNPLNNVSVLNV
ncbi:hypothetical protein ILYODFUR_025972 [Ilyodon furcidens]|uniref:Secreted protein n=1 Tax=Ilyodon furcidens TaxID=33524 RepID=A0ABV0V661_9TELE